MATTCPVFTADEWAQRLLRLFPTRWTSDSAKQVGGVLYSVFNAMGSQFTFLQNELLYAFKSSRIMTATDVALDLIAADLFGETKYYPATVVRTAGETDDSFRARILAAMFVGGATRAALLRVLSRLTGTEFRIIEPWRVQDCAALDAVSYADVDTIDNPGRISSAQRVGSLFIEGQLPSFSGAGTYPIYGLDKGAAADRTFIIDPKPTRFQGAKQLDALINKTKAQGVRVYRKYTHNAVVKRPISNTKSVPAHSPKITIGLFPPFAAPYVVIAQASWQTDITVKRLSNGEFDLIFSVPPATRASVDWYAAPFTDPGFGTLPIAAGAPGAEITLPSGYAGGMVFAIGNWNTVIYGVEPVPGDMYATLAGKSYSQSLLLSSDELSLYVSWFDGNADTYNLSRVQTSDLSVQANTDYGGNVSSFGEPFILQTLDGSRLFAFTHDLLSTNYTLFELNPADLSVINSQQYSFTGNPGDITPSAGGYLWACVSSDGNRLILNSHRNNSPSPNNQVLRIVDLTDLGLAAADVDLAALYTSSIIPDQDDPDFVWLAYFVLLGGSDYAPKLDRISLLDGSVDDTITLPTYSTPFGFSNTLKFGGAAVTFPAAVAGKTYAIYTVQATTSQPYHAIAHVVNLTDRVVVDTLDLGLANNFDTDPFHSSAGLNLAISDSGAWALTLDNDTDASTVLKLSIDGSATVTPHSPVLVPNLTDWQGIAVKTDNSRVFIAYDDDPLVVASLIS